MSVFELERHATDTLWRRIVTFAPAALITGAAIWLMATALAGNGLTPVELGLLLLFGITFGWIALSFSVGLIGFTLELLRRHPVTLGRIDAICAADVALSRPVAVLMPIFNEDPRRVFAGLISTYRSLEETASATSFTFFILSDTTDSGIASEEEKILAETRAELGEAARLFYRRRDRNLRRKAGNIADWVQSCGDAYDCMVILDADSVMSGSALMRLAALMEANPRTGIIQTLAIPASRETLFARFMQFASRLYGPVLAAGQSFWQLGDANYFGHNAIIRVRPFAEHCMLPVLPGSPPLGGEILSHDFVEAAFMRRAGWYVWLLPELPGSFEELPSNLIDYAARDRRWVQGNLQHLRLLQEAGHWVSRLHLTLGAMAYLAAPLWLLMLLLTSGVVIHEAIVGHAFFGMERTLFPSWPDYRPGATYALLAMTAAVLLGPKILALGLAMLDSRRRALFGGGRRLALSALAELVFSILLAPVLMMLHTRFVVTIALGSSVSWNAQPRGDQAVSWAAAARRHWLHTLIGCTWAALMYRFAPDFLPWVVPVVLGLMLAIPTNVISSRVLAGRWARYFGLLSTPEEIAPPAELQMLRTGARRTASVRPDLAHPVERSRRATDPVRARRG